MDRLRLTGRDFSFSSSRPKSGSTRPPAIHGTLVLPACVRRTYPRGAGTVPEAGPATRHLAGAATDVLHRSPSRW